MGIFKKGDNWYIDYYVSNRRKREKVGSSRKLAETVLAKRKTQIAEGKFLDISKVKRVKLSDFVTLFVETYSKPNKTSWKDDLERLSRAAGLLGKDKYLDEVTPYNIEEFKKLKLQEGLEPSTVNRYLTVLKTMFKKAIEWGNAEKNPLITVKHFKENKPIVRYLDKEEIAKLVEACDPYMKAVVLTALNTGMRKGEMLALKWTDIDLKNNMVLVRKTKNNEPKIIPINMVLKRVLVNLREHSSGEVVFPLGVDKLFSRAAKYAKITNSRFGMPDDNAGILPREKGKVERIDSRPARRVVPDPSR
ncbi:MAG: tyrosine-type recombinase/integrase [Candidatus Omnitrophica bacterium]|nr:tyrosine-type recombinase/integrase [Candidatus Omnitrophota bacterium]